MNFARREYQAASQTEGRHSLVRVNICKQIQQLSLLLCVRIIQEVGHINDDFICWSFLVDSRVLCSICNRVGCGVLLGKNEEQGDEDGENREAAETVTCDISQELTAELLRDLTTDWDSLHGALLSTQNWPMFLRVPENHFEVSHWTCS